LKRRVASLPPLSSEVFAEKVVHAQATSSAAAARASFERVCDVCQRTYYSENAFQNHTGSQKHRLRLAALEANAGAANNNETGSIVSSTISFGNPVGPATADSVREESDSEAEAEFTEVVNAMRQASVTDAEPVLRRPTRPHHSAELERAEHPISPEKPASSTAASDRVTSPMAATAKPAAAAAVAATSTPPELLSCLFCNYNSPSLPLNVLHMDKIHGMFIPEQQYLVDLAGLVRHLHQKIFELHQCLFCEKAKGTSSGVQTHMRDKGHCMIAFDTEEQMLEIGQFYDFRSTYSDGDDDDHDDDDDDENQGVEVDGDASHGKAAASAATNGARTADGNGNGKGNEDADADADGWETDTSASSLDSADLTAVPLDHRHRYKQLAKHLHHSPHDPRPHHAADGWHSHAHNHPYAVYYDYELHLPSGRAVGHRSLARYYRQNLRHHPGPQASSAAAEASPLRARRALRDGNDDELGDTTDGAHASTAERERVADGSGDDNADDDGTAVSRGRQVATRTVARGELGMAGVTDAKRREVAAREARERRQEQRDRARYQWAVERRSNHQKHFRVKCLFLTPPFFLLSLPPSALALPFPFFPLPPT
jgi:pre-60S factor REI1